jgi:hypothetical protein
VTSQWHRSEATAMSSRLASNMPEFEKLPHPVMHPRPHTHPDPCHHHDCQNYENNNHLHLHNIL